MGTVGHDDGRSMVLVKERVVMVLLASCGRGIAVEKGGSGV